MFVDYLTVMEANLAAGMFILALYIYYGLDGGDQKQWVPAFYAVGLIGTVSGFHHALFWPLPGVYNIAFGEPYLLFGVLFLFAGYALKNEMGLAPLAGYAVMAGLVAITVGARILDAGYTKSPEMTGFLYIIVGMGGVMAFPVIYLKANKGLRMLSVAVCLLAAVLWGFNSLGAYWGHMSTDGSFGKWKPIHMQYQIQMNAPKN